jgi:2'-5' RNA ligase
VERNVLQKVFAPRKIFAARSPHLTLQRFGEEEEEKVG